MLKLSECDVHPLTTNDFIEEVGRSPDKQTFPYTLEEMNFYIGEVKLCEMLGAVSTKQYCSCRLQASMTGSLSQREAVVGTGQGDFHERRHPLNEQDIFNDGFDQQLEAWLTNCAPGLHYDVDDIQKHRFLPAVLHIIFL